MRITVKLNTFYERVYSKMFNTFHLGSYKTKSKVKNRESQINIVVRSVKVAPVIKSRFLIPTKYYTKFMFPFLQAVRANYNNDGYMNCLAYIEKIKSFKAYPKHMEIPYGGAWTHFTRDSLSYEIIQRCLTLNERFRWAMKRLIYRWRISRCKIVNEEDVFTGEIPIKLIEIYDWSHRRKYLFEAATVYRDYLTKIYNANSLFVNPILPRNPFTNAELTYGQIHFLIRAMIMHGFNHWSFDAMKRCDYSTESLYVVYESPLKHDNLKNIFKKPTESECVDIVYDFINYEYAYYSVENTYKNEWYLALKEYPDLEIIREWRSLALRHQQLVICYEGDMFDYKMKPIHEESCRLMMKSITEMHNIYKRGGSGFPEFILGFPVYYYMTPHAPTMMDESDGTDSF